MPSAYTPLLNFVLPVTGELDGVWGTTVNTELTDNIEASIAGASIKSFPTSETPNTAWTLSTTNAITGVGGSHESRSAILVAYGTPGATCSIYAPQSSKTYIVVNNFTDQSSVYLRGGTSTSATTGVEIEAGGSALCAWDTNTLDFIKIAGGGGGAAGAGADQIFFENDLTVTGSYSIPSGKNAGTFGPVTINDGVTVTVPDGSVWSIV